MTSAIPLQRSANWTNKSTGSWSLFWLQINPWSGEQTTVNMWKSYIWTADKNVNMKAIFAVTIFIFTIAQEVRIAKVMGSNPLQAWIFFRPFLRYCSRSVRYCEDRFHIHVFIRSSNVWLSYIHNRLQSRFIQRLNLLQWCLRLI